MANIQGPIGTGDRFKNKVVKLKAKGKTDLQARRIVAGSGIEKEFQNRKRRKNVRRKNR